jgi:hypothetical protein
MKGILHDVEKLLLMLQLLLGADQPFTNKESCYAGLYFANRSVVAAALAYASASAHKLAAATKVKSYLTSIIINKFYFP